MFCIFKILKIIFAYIKFMALSVVVCCNSLHKKVKYQCVKVVNNFTCYQVCNTHIRKSSMLVKLNIVCN